MGHVETAEELLRRAIEQGERVRGRHVNAETFPDAARTYLADGTGFAWVLPRDLRVAGVFVVDAESVSSVRPILVRRYGVTDPAEFAAVWTRAEVWAKLFDIPIITWLSRHGLAEPEEVLVPRRAGAIAWRTLRDHDTITTFGVRHPDVVGGGV